MMDTMALPPHGYHPSPQPPPMSPNPAIDPALANPAIDPAILGDACDVQQLSPSQLSQARSPNSTSKFEFEQGPQGDPFAPLTNDTFLPPRVPSPPRPLKRKRKTRPIARRDEDCSFCQGNDGSNKNQQPEEMVSCVACGRSGHPSCLGIEGIANVLRSYPWNCIECKICELCEKKGNGDRMLFCDACDRGWHMDCLNPPLDSTPDGSWMCPLCSLVPSLSLPQENAHDPSLSSRPVPSSPMPSVASSSRLPQQSEVKSRKRAPGRVKPKFHDDMEVDVTPLISHQTEAELRVGNKGRGKMKGKGQAQTDIKGKGKARAPQACEDLPAALKLNPRLRAHLRSRSPNPTASTTRKVRLVVRKPKVSRDDDDEDSPDHIFEGVLKPEEYSTANTHILDSDKSFFNRSRTRAEVRFEPC
ncbi:hypothetical protein K439DRAFT_1059479 [Ramaria rubella]|nr:hypothetical protein K439DRAFT_1059479 [Ramaria rubella]